ncbi:MAG TPA: hypothetical protein VMF05_07555 [Stellaceae bacterium]|nr:hypothetical protein [Stellaceae bacterium]
MRDEALCANPPPVIVVYTLAHAVGALTAAVRARCAIVLSSAPEAGVYAGPGWFRALIAAARDAVPTARCSALLDCGGEAGAALAAIRAEIECVLFTGRGDVAARLADIARRHGVRLETARPAVALDLGDDFFAAPEQIERHCFRLLSRCIVRRVPGAAPESGSGAPPACRPGEDWRG